MKLAVSGMHVELMKHSSRFVLKSPHALFALDDPEIGKAPDWRMPVDQPRYTDSPNDERWDYAIGEGISAYTLVQRGPRKHAGHMIKAVLVKEDADGGDPRLKRLVSDLYSCFSNGETYAWWYCYDCCVWFRLGVDYLEDNGLEMADSHNAAVSRSSSPAPQLIGGPDVDLAGCVASTISNITFTTSKTFFTSTYLLMRSSSLGLAATRYGLRLQPNGRISTQGRHARCTGVANATWQYTLTQSLPCRPVSPSGF
jgi:hypothetical protein